MANDKQPRSTTAKKTTRTRTSEAAIATARNAVIEGNATIDLDDVRKRAYELYEEGGRMEGRHEEHWYRAETELRNSKNGTRKHKKIA